MMFLVCFSASFILVSLASGGTPATPSADAHTSSIAATRARTPSEADTVREKFGLRGDGRTDDTAALRSALSAAGAAPQGELRLPVGTYRFTGPLALPLGVSLVGSGPSFGTVLLADGPSAQIRLVGRESGSNGWVFRQRILDLTIRPSRNTSSAKVLVEVESAYNIQLRDVLVSDVPADTTVIELRDSNAVVLQNVVIRGRDDLSSQRSAKGIVVRGTSSIALYSPDVEVMNKGIEIHDASQVDVFSPYMERNIVGVENDASTLGKLQIFGGRIFVPNDVCHGVRASSGDSRTEIWGTYIHNQNGVNRVSMVPRATLVFHDPTTGRITVGPSSTFGEVPPAETALQVNFGRVPGPAYGLGIGPFREYISDDVATGGDWVFSSPAHAARAARFIGDGAASLDLVTDGSVMAARRVSGGRVELAFDRHILLDASLGNIFELHPGDSEPFEIDNPVNSTPGQLIILRVVNTHGHIGFVTWGSAFRLAQWSHPAVGHSRSITFMFDGSRWVEVSRSVADIPN